MTAKTRFSILSLAIWCPFAVGMVAVLSWLQPYFRHSMWEGPVFISGWFIVMCVAYGMRKLLKKLLMGHVNDADVFRDVLRSKVEDWDTSADWRYLRTEDSQTVSEIRSFFESHYTAGVVLGREKLESAPDVEKTRQLMKQLMERPPRQRRGSELRDLGKDAQQQLERIYGGATYALNH